MLWWAQFHAPLRLQKQLCKAMSLMLRAAGRQYRAARVAGRSAHVPDADIDVGVVAPQLGDCVRCLHHLTALDAGMESLISGYAKAVPVVVEALEPLDDSGRVQAVAVLTALVNKSDDGHAAVAVALLKEVRANSLASSALERLVASLHGASVDLRVAAVILLNALLTRGQPDTRAKLVHALLVCELADELEAMAAPRDCDPELRMLVNVLRERSPEFRGKDALELCRDLQEALRGTGASDSLMHVMRSLRKLDHAPPAAWRCFEAFVDAVAAAPLEPGNTPEQWFNGLLVGHVLRSEACAQLLQARLGSVGAEVRVSEAAASWDAPWNGLAESSDESSEYVDIALDGVRSVRLVQSHAVRPLDQSLSPRAAHQMKTV